MMNETISYLGRFGRDKVTGFEGVVSSVSFDLYGCVLLVLTPPVDKDGKSPDGHWFDVNRVTLLDRERVMEVPAFTPKVAHQPQSYEHGPAEKPPLPR